MIRIAKTFKRLMITGFILLASILLIIQIPMLNTSLTQSLINFVFPSDYQVTISKIQGSFPFEIHIQTIEISDSQGVWAKLDNFDYTWRAINLLFGNIHFDRISIEKIDVTRFPLSSGTVSWKIPHKIPHLNIDRLHLPLLILPYNDFLKGERFSILGEISSDYSDNHSLACFVSRSIGGNDSKDFITIVSKIEKNRLVLTAHVDDDLPHFLTYLNQDVSDQTHGDISAKIKIITDHDFKKFYVSLGGSLDHIQTPQSRLGDFCDGSLLWKIKLIKEPNDPKIRLNHLTFRTNRGAFTTGDLTYDPDTTEIYGKIQLNFPYIQQYLGENEDLLSGDGSLQGIITSNLADQKCSLLLSSTGFLLKKEPLEDMKGDCTVQWADRTKPMGTIRLQLQHKDVLTKLKTQIWAQEKNMLELKDIHLKGPGMDIMGALALNLELLSYTGQLTGKVSDLSVYSPLLNTPLKGELEFSANKQEDDQLHIAADLSNFQMDKLSGDHISIDGYLKKMIPENLFVKAKNFFFNSSSPQKIETLDFSLKKEADHAVFSLKGESQKKSLTCLGKINHNFSQSDSPSHQITVTSLLLSNQDKRSVMLQKPALITLDNKGFMISDVKLSVESGSIALTNVNVGDLLSGTLKIHEFPLEALFFFHGEEPPISGALNADMSLSGTSDNPSLSLALKGNLKDKSTRFGKQGKAVKIIGYELKGTQKDNILTLEGDVISRKILTLKAKGMIKTKGFAKPSDSLTGKVSISGNISALNAFVFVNDRLSGESQGDLTLSGSLEAPQLTGQLSVRNGLFEDAEKGTILHNISIRAHIDNSQLRITECGCVDFYKGSAKCIGSIDLTNPLKPHLDLGVDFTNYVIVNSDDFMAKANGVLQLKSQSTGHLLISGAVTMSSGELTLQDSQSKRNIMKVYEDPKLIKKSSDKHYVVTYEKGMVLLDITTQIPDAFHIYGSGLKSQWTGTLVTRGNADRSKLDGVLTLVKGDLEVASKSMTLIEGKITYTDDKEKDPDIILVATREISGHTVFFRVEGKASKPTMTVSSVPALPQQQALALVLFGKSISAISPAQSLKLALASGALKDTKGLNITDTIGQAFGFDRLSLEQDETASSDPDLNPGYKVRLGKQLNDRIYIGLDQGLTKETGTSATMEVDVTKNTKVQLNIGTGERSNSLSYNWEKKY